MLNIYKELLEMNFKYDSNIRKQYEELFEKICNNEFDYFKKYLALAYELDVVLTESYDKSKSDKEYYTRLIHIRSIDHYVSGNLLYAKGYTIDAYTSVRSALEDSWIIQNFWLTDNYFNKWKNGCKIKPAELRNCPQIDNDLIQLFNDIYPPLCNISHCRINSIHLMTKTHVRIQRDETERNQDYKKNYIVLVASFYIYLVGVIKAIEENYNNDKLKLIYEELNKISILKMLDN